MPPIVVSGKKVRNSKRNKKLSLVICQFLGVSLTLSVNGAFHVTRL